MSIDALFKGDERDVDERSKKIFDLIGGGIDELNSKTNQLKRGPLPRNQATVDFQYITECLCNPVKKDSVKISMVNNAFQVTIDNRTYNLSQILQNMDSRQLTISEEAKNAYAKQIPTLVNGLPKLDAHYAQLYKDVHVAEKAAIRLYTGENYERMNAFMRGSVPENIANANDEALVNMLVSELIIQNAFALTGLKKIPDTDVKIAFRGEHSTPQRKAEMAKAVEDPEKVIFEKGFISTSSGGLGKFGSDVGIMFHNVKGKDVGGLSPFQEREILMMPTQVQYQAKKQGDKTYYVATPVITPSGLTPEQQKVGFSPEQMQERKEKVDNLLNAVKDIKSTYTAMNPGHKVSFFRNREIQQLVKSADKLLKDPNMPFEQKEEKIWNKLMALDMKVKHQSRLKQAISKTITAGYAVEKDPPSKTVLTEYNHEKGASNKIKDSIHPIPIQAKEENKENVKRNNSKR